MPVEIILMTALPTVIATVGGVTAIWIITRTWLRYKRSPSTDDLLRISESLEALHQSVDDLRDDLRGRMSEVRELSSRIEFAERLLTEQRKP